MWDNYYNKKVVITEKLYATNGSELTKLESTNRTVGIITNALGSFESGYIELDNKILISLKYVYKIEIID